MTVASASSVWFTATVGAAEQLDDLNAYVVVLAEERDGDGRRLELQRALVIDEQDRSLGMDTYCLCTHTGATHYGGVSAWSVEEGQLTLELDADAALVLDVERELVIELRLSDEELSAVAAGIERVLSAGVPS